MKLPWLIWATYSSFPKISENKTDNDQKTRGRVNFHAPACFTSYFVSCFPIFHEMENTPPHKILRGRVFFDHFPSCFLSSGFWK